MTSPQLDDALRAILPALNVGQAFPFTTQAILTGLPSIVSILGWSCLILGSENYIVLT